jgi:hypothetical protein
MDKLEEFHSGVHGVKSIVLFWPFIDFPTPRTVLAKLL